MRISRALLLAVVVSAGCGLFEPGTEVTGTVRHLSLEGGCWVLRTDDGRTLEPTNLPAAFLSDGLPVRARVEERHDLASACQVGQIVTVLHIERR